MKVTLKPILIATLLLTAGHGATASASGVRSLEELQSSWSGTTIAVKTGAEPTVMQLVRAFHSQWPTIGVADLLAHAGNACEYSDDYTFVDCVDFGCASYDHGDTGAQRVQARVYPRDNGHTLFAIAIEELNPELMTVACFYDYNPSTSTMTPEALPFATLSRLWPDSAIEISLGKGYDNTVVVSEISPQGEWWHHHYAYNGMKHVYYDSGSTAYGSDDEEQIPAGALKRWENDKVEIFSDLINGNEPANYAVWLRDKQSGEVRWLFTTNNLAPAHWADMKDGNGTIVANSEIAVGDIDNIYLLPWSSTLLLVEGCPDARNVWTYIIDLENRKAVQLPSTEGVGGLAPKRRLIYARSYRYYPEGGRYSVERAYTADGKYSGDERTISE